MGELTNNVVELFSTHTKTLRTCEDEIGVDASKVLDEALNVTGLAASFKTLQIAWPSSKVICENIAFEIGSLECIDTSQKLLTKCLEMAFSLWETNLITKRTEYNHRNDFVLFVRGLLLYIPHILELYVFVKQPTSTTVWDPIREPLSLWANRQTSEIYVTSRSQFNVLSNNIEDKTFRHIIASRILSRADIVIVGGELDYVTNPCLEQQL